MYFEAKLTEKAVQGDPYSRQEQAVPTFFGYGSNGNVTGRLVYANYGSREDFETLASLGINVENKIVLVRYGNVFRGLKVRAAELTGAEPTTNGAIRSNMGPRSLSAMAPKTACVAG